VPRPRLSRHVLGRVRPVPEVPGARRLRQRGPPAGRPPGVGKRALTKTPQDTHAGHAHHRDSNPRIFRPRTTDGPRPCLTCECCCRLLATWLLRRKKRLTSLDMRQDATLSMSSVVQLMRAASRLRPRAGSTAALFSLQSVDITRRIRAGLPRCRLNRAGPCSRAGGLRQTVDTQRFLPSRLLCCLTNMLWLNGGGCLPPACTSFRLRDSDSYLDAARLAPSGSVVIRLPSFHLA